MLEFRGPFGTSEAFLGPLGPYVRNTWYWGCAPVQILQDLQPLRHIWENFRGQLMNFLNI